MRVLRPAAAGLCRGNSAAVGGKWTLNKQRIGFSEVQLVQKMIDGVTKLVASRSGWRAALPLRTLRRTALSASFDIYVLDA